MEDETNDQTKRIPIDDADAATLKHFAEMALGIEVKLGTNAASLRAKIRAAMPDVKDVPALPPEPKPVVMPEQQAVHVQTPFIPPINQGNSAEIERPAAVSRPASQALMHPRLDPKVTIEIARTDDKRRAKEVTVSVNGNVWRMQRGQKIDVPYRVYLALLNAKEKAAVETDEINPITGMPVVSWEEVYSYPFSVHKMPSDEEVAAWEAATGSGFAQQAA